MGHTTDSTGWMAFPSLSMAVEYCTPFPAFDEDALVHYSVYDITKSQMERLVEQEADQ